ncbi:MAG: TonB-dependent receptor, partial [Pseudomonadota bacterium]
PLRRAAPLDIIPTSVVGGSFAQKTFSPQFSGEFGGAAIDLQTIARPAENFLTLEVDFSIDTETTMRNGLFYDGSDTDFLGFDDGLRNLPAAASDVIATGAVADQLVLDTSFDQDQTLLITGETIPASGGGSVTVGRIFDFDSGATFGTTSYIGYSNDWEHREGFADRNDAFASGVFVTSQPQEFTFTETRQNIQLNALNTTGYQSASGDHEVALTTYLLRDSLKRARLADVIAQRDIGDDPLRQENTDWLERQIWQAQLTGNHIFPDAGDFEANWRVSYGEAEREAPYERKTLRQLNPATGSFQYFNNGRSDNRIVFSDLKDENIFAALDLTKPFELETALIDVKVGASYTDNSRNTNRNIFNFNEDRQLNAPELLDSRIDLIYSDEVLATDIVDIFYINTPQEPDNSTGDLEVMAAYAMANVEFNDYLTAMVGVRFEDGEQASSTQLVSRPETLTQFAPIEEEYFLPAATVTWRPNSDIQIRAGYSETISRPQFRELVFTDFLDLDYDIVLRGNPFLQNSELTNYDVRAEWYFGSRGEFVTVGAFFKEIENPIEQFKTTGEDEAFSFINAPSAEVFGVEAEFQKTIRLDDWFNNSWAVGKELLFLTNYTYTDSEVQSSDTETVILASGGASGVVSRELLASQVVRDGRPLVGQSDHLFNLQLGYENVDTGTRVTALVNYASERVLFAEANASDSTPPAIVEQPPVSEAGLKARARPGAGGMIPNETHFLNALHETVETG